MTKLNSDIKYITKAKEVKSKSKKKIKKTPITKKYEYAESLSVLTGKRYGVLNKDANVNIKSWEKQVKKRLEKRGIKVLKVSFVETDGRKLSHSSAYFDIKVKKEPTKSQTEKYLGELK